MKNWQLPPREDLVAGLNFLSGLPHFFRRPLILAKAEAILQSRFATREAHFLSLLKRGIFNHEDNIYCKLLKRIHCNYEDLVVSVQKLGVEGTLESLLQQGVFLTLDEFKGRKAVIRGSSKFTVVPENFTRPDVASLQIQTSGSSGQRGHVPVNFAYIGDRSVNVLLDLAARQGLAWKHGVWGIPSGSSLVHILELCGAGIHPSGWFTHIDPSAEGLHARYQWGIRAIRMGSVLSLHPLPRLHRASVEDPSSVLVWLKKTQCAGFIPHLFGYVSSVVRLCEAAGKAGMDLRSCSFTVTGEPFSPSRAALIRSSGAMVTTRYGAAEAGSIGYGCLQPECVDDVHLLHDRVAVIQTDGEGDGDNLAKPLFVTSLLPSSPLLLLNVSLGDKGVITRRQCGCSLERYGWHTHVHSVSSSEKFTCEGMSFPQAAIVRIVEEVLPARFGGNSTHYQLVEGHDEKGLTVLNLLVHPSVGTIDEQALVAVFYDALDPAGGVETIMKGLWREARLIQVMRRPPFTTSSGKIRHICSSHRQPSIKKESGAPSSA
jgi:hypothetical protein